MYILLYIGTYKHTTQTFARLWVSILYSSILFRSRAHIVHIYALLIYLGYNGKYIHIIYDYYFSLNFITLWFPRAFVLYLNIPSIPI